jgi:hypothetical protein
MMPKNWSGSYKHNLAPQRSWKYCRSCTGPKSLMKNCLKTTRNTKSTGSELVASSYDTWRACLACTSPLKMTCRRTVSSRFGRT